MRHFNDRLHHPAPTHACLPAPAGGRRADRLPAALWRGALGGRLCLGAACGPQPGAGADSTPQARAGRVAFAHHATWSPGAAAPQHCRGLLTTLVQRQAALAPEASWQALLRSAPYRDFAARTRVARAHACPLPRALAGDASATPSLEPQPNEDGFSTAPAGEEAGNASPTQQPAKLHLQPCGRCEALEENLQRSYRRLAAHAARAPWQDRQAFARWLQAAQAVDLADCWGD